MFMDVIIFIDFLEQIALETDGDQNEVMPSRLSKDDTSGI